MPRTPRFPRLLPAAVLMLCGRFAAGAADGYFDPAYAAAGSLIFDGGFAVASSSYAALARPEPDGRVLLAGPLQNTGGWWLAELSSNGTFVPTFGASDGSGRTTSCQLLGACGTSEGVDAVRLADGRYLVLGGGTITRTSAAAHSSERSVPTSALIINDVQGRLTAPTSLAVSSVGKVLVAGVANYSLADTKARIGIARLTSDLDPDPSFAAGIDGAGVAFAGGTILTFDQSAPAEYVVALLVQGDDRIVVVGFSYYGASAYRIGVARLDSDGTLDGTFGAGGIKLLDPGPFAGAATLDNAGRIFLAVGTSTSVGVVRLSSNGNLDFLALVPIASLGGAACNAVDPNGIALDSAGRALVAGSCRLTAPDNDFIALRFRGDTGALDTSFGVSGESYGYYDASSSFNTAQAVAFDTTGHPVIAGRAKPGDSTYKTGVGRLAYDLVYTGRFEAAPRGCLPPHCN